MPMTVQHTTAIHLIDALGPAFGAFLLGYRPPRLGQSHLAIHADIFVRLHDFRCRSRYLVYSWSPSHSADLRMPSKAGCRGRCKNPPSAGLKFDLRKSRTSRCTAPHMYGWPAH